jgi:hypothetical protein
MKLIKKWIPVEAKREHARFSSEVADEQAAQERIEAGRVPERTQQPSERKVCP